MISFQLARLPDESMSLAEFIVSDQWPFHATPHNTLDKNDLQKQFAQTDSRSTEYFWIVDEGLAKIGLLKLFDLDDIADDGYPMFDLRVLSRHRGKGVGREAVRWLSSYLFKRWPELDYIQGSTREDNFAMRKVFLRCYFAKEGHLRKNWDGVHASILYGLLREDWETSSVTPVNWNDETELTR